MKKTYVTPEARLYDISTEEKIAADCSGYSIFDFVMTGCTSELRAKDGNCIFGVPFGS